MKTLLIDSALACVTAWAIIILATWLVAKLSTLKTKIFGPTRP